MKSEPPYCVLGGAELVDTYRRGMMISRIKLFINNHITINQILDIYN